MKDTALLEQGRGVAWAQHAMCELALRHSKDIQAGLQQNSILSLCPTLYNLQVSYAPQTLCT